MESCKKSLLLIGRVFLSFFFILSAIHKVIDWQNVERGLTSLLCDWHTYVSGILPMQNLFANLMPFVHTFLAVSALIEFVGGLLIFFGFKVRFGAFLLLIFMLITTPLLHHFWFLEGIQREMQMVLFLKNLAIMGGILYLLVLGTGSKPKLPPIVLPSIKPMEKKNG